MRVVVSHLYNDRDVFVRELRASRAAFPITVCVVVEREPSAPLTSLLVLVNRTVSNANDALEKVRLVSLTDSSIFTPAPSLNVSVIADADGGRIVIRGASRFRLAVGTAAGSLLLSISRGFADARLDSL